LKSFFDAIHTLNELKAVVERAKAGLAALAKMTRQIPRKSDVAFRFIVVLLVFGNFVPTVELLWLSTCGSPGKTFAG
jgi:hypothetical protein